MPFQIGALIDGSHRKAAEAGLFGFLQISSLSAGMMLISPWAGGLAPRTIAIAGCGLAAAANMALYLAGSLYLQLLLAIVTGFGYGLIFAATVSAAACSRDPDRVYSIGNGGALLIVVGLMSILPLAVSYWGTVGIFAALSVMSLACSPLFIGFKLGKRLDEPELGAWRTPGAPGLLIAWVVASTGTSALYAFSERLGRNIHLPASQLVTVLSSGVFVGLIGTGAAALLGRRVNRPLALMVGMSGSGAACLMLGFAANLTMYAAGVFMYWIFYMFLYSYLLGTAALLDPAGRVGTLAGGVERLGYALGAGVGGLLAEHESYRSIGTLGFLSCVLGMAFGFPSLFRELAARRHAAAPECR